MKTFKNFLTESEEKDNVKELIAKLPKKHQQLIKGYKFHYTSGNTLPGDDGHVGVVYKDKITVAAPWNYGRAFVTLHEIAHVVYEHLMTPELKKEWKNVVKKHPNPQEKNAEENFAMAYACFYSKHKVETYHKPAWMEFIKNKVPN